MPDGGGPAIIKATNGIENVDPAAWDACAGAENPFVCHAFLQALEASGSAQGESGWLPQHLLVEDEAGTLLGCAPMYLKSHSYGEYVFDHAWADAYERAGGRYYPKLQLAVPFTPVTGPRLMARPGTDTAAVTAALIEGVQQVAVKLGVSTAHVTFPSAAEWHSLGAAGWLQRTGQQYHWVNDGYDSFDDFLAALNSRKRKAIKKERRAVAESGIDLEVLTGDDLKPIHWDAFFRFYMDTGSRKWGMPYLTREFFDILGDTMADRVALVVAKDGGRLVAGALNLIGTSALFGRNWGCVGDYRFLHFEACYYQAIDFAIRTGLKTVEAGAQGQHKIQRGYLPTKTYSAHWVRDPGFRDAIADFLDRETDRVDWELEALSEWSPFKKGDQGAAGSTFSTDGTDAGTCG